MATSSASAVPAQPAAPEDRAKENLEPLSYAAAAEPTHQASTEDHHLSANGHISKVSGDSDGSEKVIRPILDRSEYSGAGQNEVDDVTTIGHKRRVSSKDGGSPKKSGKKRSSGNGDGSLKEVNNGHKDESANGTKRQSKIIKDQETVADKVLKDPNLEVEDYVNVNGEKLTSTKTSDENERITKKAKKTPNNNKDDLVSGRTAGANWDKSGYVSYEYLQSLVIS
jgi:hypothetical protein